MNAICITLLLLMACCAEPKSVTLGYENWTLYHEVDSRGFHTGFEYSLIKQVMDTMGVTLKFEKSNWDNLLRMLKVGRVDMLEGAGYTKERAQFAYYSVPYRYESFSLFIRRTPENDRISDKELFAAFASGKITTAISAGYFYGEETDSILNRVFDYSKLLTLSSYSQAIPLLKSGRISSFIMETESGRSKFSKAELVSYVRIVPLPNGGPLYLLFSKKSVSKSFVELYNSTYSRLLKNGHLNNLYQKSGISAPAINK